MICEAEDFYITLVEDRDIKDILKVYNSNQYFLQNHMGTDNVTYKWISNEVESMKLEGFNTYKVVEKNSHMIIGIIDLKIANETYLSLLMLNSNYKGKGLGKKIYKSLEQYVKSLDSKCIRIDVVINYDNNVLEFWIDNGFEKVENIELNWTGKSLPAVIMKKSLE